MIFLNSSGLRALYNEINRCSMIDLYQPAFSYNNDSFLEDLKDFVSGREKLRIVRNFILLNGAS